MSLNIENIRALLIDLEQQESADDQLLAEIEYLEFRLETLAENSKVMALLRELMGEAVEGCGLLESVALLASQRENARNAHAATKKEEGRLREALEDISECSEYEAHKIAREALREEAK